MLSFPGFGSGRGGGCLAFSIMKSASDKKNLSWFGLQSHKTRMDFHCVFIVFEVGWEGAAGFIIIRNTCYVMHFHFSASGWQRAAGFRFMRNAKNVIHFDGFERGREGGLPPPET